MNTKITTVRPKYPIGQEPDICIPNKYNEYYRFLLGRKGSDPLVVIGMNPSAANEEYSDRTINRIIAVSHKLGKDGWIVANVYPERATNSAHLDDFNMKLAQENCQIILNFLQEYGIREVWGAWGNLNHPSLIEGNRLLLAALAKNNIKVCTFAPLTLSGQPVHPLNRSVKQDFTIEGKRYL